MASPVRPSIVLGPNVAQVRPMVHTLPAMTETVTQTVRPQNTMSLLGPNPITTTTLIQQATLPAPTPRGTVGKPLTLNTSTVMVPPGRYKYNSATCNGKQGVYLIPIENSSVLAAPSKGVFVPFNTDGGNPVLPPGLIPSNVARQQNASKLASTQLANIAAGVNTSKDKNLMNLSTIVPTAPQPKIVFNIVQGATGTAAKLTTQYAITTTTTPVTNSLNTLQANFHKSIPSSMAGYKPVYLSYPGKSLYMNPTTSPSNVSSQPVPCGVVYRQVTHNTKPSGTGSSVSILTGNKMAALPMRPISHTGQPTGSLSFLPLSQAQGQSQMQTEANTQIIQDKATVSTKHINQNDSSETESAISGTLDASAESDELPFKIDSVFSLCADTEAESEPPEDDQIQLDGCPFPESWFVVLENLDLKGMLSIDVRKFRKFTGRQSCSNTCRESSLIKLCRKQNLVIFENAPVKVEEAKSVVFGTNIGDVLGTNDIEEGEVKVKREKFEEDSLLESVDTSSAMYKPGPKSKKILRIKMLRKQKKVKKREERRQIEEEKRLREGTVATDHLNTTLKQFPGRSLLKDIKPDQSSLPTPSSGTVKFTPVGPQKSSNSQSDSPLLDTNSAAFKQAVAALGSKKFYLMRIEGKNILLPVEQNTLQPRAYILGGDKTPSTAKNTTRVEAPPPKTPAPTISQIPPKVKTEPQDTGYEKQALAIQDKTSIRVKEEPMNRGYSDEMSTPSKNQSSATPSAIQPSTSLSCPDSMPNLEDNSDNIDGEVPAKMPRLEPVELRKAASHERIRQLKEMLHKQQEELERVRMMRKDHSVLWDSMGET